MNISIMFMIKTNCNCWNWLQNGSPLKILFDRLDFYVNWKVHHRPKLKNFCVSLFWFWVFLYGEIEDAGFIRVCISIAQVFLSTPSVVTFTEYKVGQVYEATLDLKNISSSLRPVRVLPTSTNFFTVGLGRFSNHLLFSLIYQSLTNCIDDTHTQRPSSNSLPCLLSCT